jgi:hypothetical protein
MVLQLYALDFAREAEFVIQKESACVKTQESVTLSGVEGC